MFMWRRGSFFALGVLQTTAYPATSLVHQCNRASCVVAQDVPPAAPSALGGTNPMVVAAGITITGAIVCAIITGIIGPLILYVVTKPAAAADDSNESGTGPLLPTTNDPAREHAARQTSIAGGYPPSMYPSTHLLCTRMTIVPTYSDSSTRLQ